MNLSFKQSTLYCLRFSTSNWVYCLIQKILRFCRRHLISIKTQLGSKTKIILWTLTFLTIKPSTIMEQRWNPRCLQWGNTLPWTSFLKVKQFLQTKETNAIINLMTQQTLTSTKSVRITNLISIKLTSSLLGLQRFRTPQLRIVPWVCWWSKTRVIGLITPHLW
jgi:hypothetical protein